MKMYRCTRNKPYINSDVPGTVDISSRQGYYIKANSEEEALIEMGKRFVDEINIGFTVSLWSDI